MKGILADINSIGQVNYLVARMQGEPWTAFWTGLQLTLKHFAEVGLSAKSSDLEIWQKCQQEQLILITDNRNHDSPDSLEATIRKLTTPDSLPVFTISDLNKFASSRTYADRVLERLYEYLMDIDNIRGAGRLYLP